MGLMGRGPLGLIGGGLGIDGGGAMGLMGGWGLWD